MYNPHKYSDRTINVFEKIGAYVLTVFHNQLYDKAKELKMEGQAASVTDAYKTVAKTYLQHFQNPELYQKTTKDIHKYFETYERGGSLSYTEWIDSLTREFVPEDYWSSLDGKQRGKVFGHVLEGTVRNFTVWVLTTTGLNAMIDHHGDPATIQLMQNKLNELLIEEREGVYKKFIRPLGKTSTVEDAVRDESKRLTKENIDLKAKLKSATEALQIMDKKLKYLLERAQKDEREKAEMRGRLEAILRRPPPASPSPASSPPPSAPPQSRPQQEPATRQSRPAAPQPLPSVSPTPPAPSRPASPSKTETPIQFETEEQPLSAKDRARAAALRRQSRAPESRPSTTSQKAEDDVDSLIKMISSDETNFD